MLDVTVNSVQGAVPVTVMRLNGELDASNFESLITQTQSLYAEGSRDLLLDLEKLSFLSSSGLVAFHRMALVMRGEALDAAEEGWGAFHAISREVEQGSGPEPHYKLLNPQATVRKVLDTSGFSRIMAIFEDENEALASFGQV
ncbi:MAG: STAS domain-containing protein [Chloroflexota bacterium]|jgi:anti-anti-sigma factor